MGNRLLALCSCAGKSHSLYVAFSLWYSIVGEPDPSWGAQHCEFRILSLKRKKMLPVALKGIPPCGGKKLLTPPPRQSISGLLAIL